MMEQDYAESNGGVAEKDGAMNGVKRTETDVRPRYVCCHPNAKGTGCSVKFELHPAHDYVEGSLFVTFAAQKSVGRPAVPASNLAGGSATGEGTRRILPTFDWENRITVRMSVNEVAAMLEVLRGYCEKMADGNGLFHRTPKANTIITLEHRLEPMPGFLFGVSRKPVDGSPRRMCVLLSMKEALVLSESLGGAMLYMAFGLPKVLPRVAADLAAGPAVPASNSAVGPTAPAVPASNSASGSTSSGTRTLKDVA